MEMMPSKKEKEKWVVSEFLPRYNKVKGSDYSLVEMIEEKGKPDSLIANSKGEKLGLEVTEYTGHPRTEAGRKKSKENQFWDIMEKKLEGYKDYGFGFYFGCHPSKKDEGEALAKKVACGIKKCINKNEQKGEFEIEDVRGIFYKGPFNNGPKIGFFVSPPEGVDSKDTQIIRDNFIKGMYNLIWKKVGDAKKYKNEEKNILVIEQNAPEVSYIDDDDLEKIIELNRQKLRKKKSIDVYEEIWLLYRKAIYSVY